MSRIGVRLGIVLIFVSMPVAALWGANPVITSISPTSGLPSTQLTITGTGLGSAPGTVTVNGAPAQIVSWNALGTQILVNAPNGVAGSGLVVVNGKSNGVNFNFTPTITNIAAQNVAVGQNDTIVGLNFGTAVGTVTVSGLPATVLFWKKNTISFTVP